MSKYATERSAWLGPALGAGFGTAAVASGFGEAAPIARRFGGWLGNVIKTATGFGEYEVRSNSLYEGAQVPFVANRPTINGTTISHREYIMDVVTSDTPGEFKSYTFDINPGLGSTFEWLSQVAVNYEEYVIEGILFVFRSMSADALNSTNTALGSVIMATQYNTYQSPFGNKAEMENHAYAMSCKPSEDMVHPIECDPHQSSITTFFVRGGSPPEGADRRLYDLGRVEIGTVGFQGAGVNIGELHVTYQVSLMKPRLYVAIQQSLPFYHITQFGGNWDGTSPMGALNPPNTTSSTNMDVTLAYAANGGFTDVTITLPPTGSPLFYSIEWYGDLGALNSTAPQASSFVNCTNFTLGYYPYVVADAFPVPRTSASTDSKGVCIAVQVAGLFKTPSLILKIPNNYGGSGRMDFYVKGLPYKAAS
jgi:hypothetical protein